MPGGYTLKRLQTSLRSIIKKKDVDIFHDKAKISTKIYIASCSSEPHQTCIQNSNRGFSLYRRHQFQPSQNKWKLKSDKSLYTCKWQDLAEVFDFLSAFVVSLDWLLTFMSILCWNSGLTKCKLRFNIKKKNKKTLCGFFNQIMFNYKWQTLWGQIGVWSVGNRWWWVDV